MYTRLVYKGNVQADNWHNVGTARYHMLEHRTRSYGAGMYHIDQPPNFLGVTGHGERHLGHS